MVEPKAAAPGPRTPRQGVQDELLGRVIDGRFRIVGRIARGGMGKVYRARQEPLGREVALKILDPRQSSHTEDFDRRFFLEAEASAKLRHPNTVTVFDYGQTDDGIYFLAMELLEGRPLHHRLREGPVEPSQAIAIAEQVCRSLREAHGLGLVHRDLKPANIFLENLTAEEHPHVKVLDFGLVKDLAVADDMTQTGLFMGSPKYMSPEQATSGPTDARSDVYSLGVTLYQMLTGKLPFEREGSVNLLMAHIQDPPPPFAERAPDVTVPAALERVVRRCLEKRPNDRFPSMNALLQVLKQTAQDLGYRAGALDGSLSGSASFVAPAMVATAPAPRPHRRLLGAGLALAALLLVVLVVALSVGDADPAANASSTEVPPPAAEPLGDDAPAGEAEPAMEADPVPARRVVLVGLRSQPAGAEVRIGDTDEVYGPTPALLEWSGADAQPGRQVTFRFTLEGHQPFTVTRTLRGDTLEVDASLVPLPEPERRPRVRTPRRPRPVPSAMMDRAQPATPSLGDYRDDPY